MKWKKHQNSITSFLEKIGMKKTTNSIAFQEKSSPPTYRLISFSLEKSRNMGEDEIATHAEETIAIVAVFDGLGGAGGTKHKFEGETRTGAYLASSLAAKSFMNFIKRQEENDIHIKNLSSDFSKQLFQDFSRFANRYLGNKTSLRGGVIHRLPTTLAAWIVFFDSNTIKALWAGDSRCYSLDHLGGLRQITKDDLVNEINPFNNIKMDAPLSNFITSDKEFSIHEKTLNINKNANQIYFVATDGVFNYYPTPMHYEYMLLRSMQKAKDEQEWITIIEKDVKEITADDASLAGIILNGEEFKRMQSAFKKRFDFVEKEYIKPLEKLSEETVEKRKELETLNSELEETKNYLWNNYQEKYSYYKKN